MSNIENLCKEFEDQVTAATLNLQRAREIVAALPPETPCPDKLILSASRGEFALRYVPHEPMAQLELLQRHFDTLALVELHGTVKCVVPVALLTAEDTTEGYIALEPVIDLVELSHGQVLSTLRQWYTRIGPFVGRIEVQLPGDAPVDLHLPADAHAVMAPQLLLLTRRTKHVVADAWATTWDQFAETEGLTEKQLRMLALVRDQLESGIPFKREHLPHPFIDLKHVEGTQVTPHSAGQLSRLYGELEARPAHPWDVVGDFHALFSLEQTERLLSFVDKVFPLRPAKLLT